MSGAKRSGRRTAARKPDKQDKPVKPPSRNRALLWMGLAAAGLLAVVAVYLWWGGGGARPFRGNTSAYNILLVTMDTTRADHLGAYGATTVRTPIIDGMADSGVVFEEAYTPAVMTLPSHTSILTGLIPPAHGVRDNGTYRLRPEVETMTEALRAAGYRTGAVVGAVVLDAMFGLNQGFESYDDNLPQSGSHDVFFSHRSATAVTDAALRWLATVKGSRWFLWAHYFDPHVPYEAPDPYRTEYQNSPYDAEIAYMDSEIGRLLAGIRQSGAGGRTIVVLVGDHGEGLRDHGEESHGVFLYDETARVPLIISVPGFTDEGRRVKAVVRTTDIMPTILDLLRLPPRVSIQGKSLWPLMAGEVKDLGLEAYSESADSALTYGWSPMASLRVGKWKYIQAPEPELYDMDADPKETRNLVASEGPTVEKLSSRLRQMLQGIVPAAGAGPPGLSADQQAGLKSLGYVSGGKTSLREKLAKDPTAILDGDKMALTDPKTQIALLDRLNHVSIAYGEGQFDTSLRLARELLASYPDNNYVREYEADSYRELKKFDDALRVYQEVLDRDPGDVQAQLNKGWVLMNLQRFDEAKAVFEKVLAVYPDHVYALSSLGDIYYVEGDYGNAAKYYRQILLNRPNHLKSVLGMAKIFEQRGMTKEAKISWKRATELAPGDLDAWLSLGWLQFADKEYDDALQTLANASHIDPNMPELNLYRGDIYLAMKKLDEAENEYRIGLKKAPQAPQGYHGLGLVALQRGDVAKARDYFNQALKVDPSYKASREQLKRLPSGS